MQQCDAAVGGSSEPCFGCLPSNSCTLTLLPMHQSTWAYKGCFRWNSMSWRGVSRDRWRAGMYRYVNVHTGLPPIWLAIAPPSPCRRATCVGDAADPCLPATWSLNCFVKGIKYLGVFNNIERLVSIGGLKSQVAWLDSFLIGCRLLLKWNALPGLERFIESGMFEKGNLLLLFIEYSHKRKSVTESQKSHF